MGVGCIAWSLGALGKCVVGGRVLMERGWEIRVGLLILVEVGMDESVVCCR